MVVEPVSVTSPQFYVKSKLRPAPLKARIFIADPSPSVCRAMQTYFETQGTDIQTTKVASEIFSTVRLWQPNIVLLSDEFYDDNPEVICHNLLADNRTAHIPVVMLLEADHQQTRMKYLEIGADQVIPKPFDLEEVRLRVETIIRFST